MARLQLIFHILEEADREDQLARQRQNRLLRTRDSWRNLSEVEFVDMYRLNHRLFENLCKEIKPIFGHARRSGAITAERKILTALLFYASGSYQNRFKKHLALSQQSVSNCINQVTDALNAPQIVHKYMRFPQNNIEREEIKQGFDNKFGMPGVVACIDGTHVALLKPAANEERFFNRKYYHSLNVQVLSDSDLRILNVDASYGGATPDAFVWNKHPVKAHLGELNQNGEDCWLVGNCGYPQRSSMMVPFDPEVVQPGSPEEHYNSIHKTTHDSMVRTIDVLKARWNCLLASREMHYAPVTAAKIVIACCVLHNMCVNDRTLVSPRLTAEEAEVENSLKPIPVLGDVRSGDDDDVENEVRMGQERGQEARDELVRRLWRVRCQQTS